MYGFLDVDGTWGMEKKNIYYRVNQDDVAVE